MVRIILASADPWRWHSTQRINFNFIDSSLPKPNSSAANYSVWIRCNNMVASWLLTSISKEIANSVLYIDTAAGILKDLHQRFCQGNGPRIFQIQKCILSLSQRQLTVSIYFTKLKGLWEELSNYKQIPTCSCGAVKQVNESYNQECIMQFLMGLNDSYSHVRGQILLIESLPSINKVFLLNVQEERQRDISSTTSHFVDISAFLTCTQNFT